MYRRGLVAHLPGGEKVYRRGLVARDPAEFAATLGLDGAPLSAGPPGHRADFARV